MKTGCKLLLLILFPFLVGIAMPEQKNTPGSGIHPLMNPDHLDGAFTGGFGEQTCRSCHFDYELNMDGGSILVEGLDESYEAGSETPVTITVQSEQLEIGGFQMTARFDDGSQAGSFEWDDDRVMITPEISDSIQYIQHSENGTNPTGDREVSWTVTWIAPENGETVLFNVAANAGNYDDSSFGDWIYSKELQVSTTTP